MPNTLLVAGATSAIVQALLRLYARDGARFILLGRDEEKLQVVSKDLIARGGEVLQLVAVDFANLTELNQRITAILHQYHDIDIAIAGHGQLGSQEKEQACFAAAQTSLTINFLSYVCLLEPIAAAFAAKQRGAIIAISSVAGDRGRQSNYIYGSAKAGLSAYLQGLRNRLHAVKVQVMTVKPGFVDTPMTAAVPKNFLFAQPAEVAQQIFRAHQQGKDIVYTPWFWRPIMVGVRLLPEFLFKRMQL